MNMSISMINQDLKKLNDTVLTYLRGEMEAHFVFYNTKYRNFFNATSRVEGQEDAVVVLAVFVNVSKLNKISAELCNFTTLLIVRPDTMNMICSNLLEY